MNPNVRWRLVWPEGTPHDPSRMGALLDIQSEWSTVGAIFPPVEPVLTWRWRCHLNGAEGETEDRAGAQVALVRAVVQALVTP